MMSSASSFAWQASPHGVRLFSFTIWRLEVDRCTSPHIDRGVFHRSHDVCDLRLGQCGGWYSDLPLDQPAFNRDRLKAEKLIDSKVLEQLIRVQADAGCSSMDRNTDIKSNTTPGL